MEMSLVDSLWFTRHTCQYCPTPLCPRANPLPHGSSITIISNISSSIDTPQQIIPQVHPTIFTPRSSIRIEPDSTPSRCSLSAIRHGRREGSASKNSGDDDDDETISWGEKKRLGRLLWLLCDNLWQSVTDDDEWWSRGDRGTFFAANGTFM